MSKNRLNAGGARRKDVTLLLVIVGAMSTFSANAQWVVTDPTHTFQNIMTQLKDMAENAKQWGTEYKQWVQTYQHYQQQLADAQKMFNPQSFMGSGFDMKKRSLDEGMEDCGTGGNPLSLSQLLQPFSFNPNGNIKQQQIDVCRRIVYADNLRYNEGVDTFLKLENQDANLQSMASFRSGATQEGKILTSNNDLMMFAAVSAAELEYSQNKIRAYGSLIGSLERDQQRLGRIALNGKTPTFGQQVLGSVVQGVTLKAALEGLD